MLAMYFYTLPDFMMFANPLLYFVEPLSWHVFDQIQRVRNPVLQLEQYHQWIRRAEGLLPIALLDLRKLLTQLFGLCPYLVRQKQITLITFRCLRGWGHFKQDTLCTYFHFPRVLDIIYHPHFCFDLVFFHLLFFNAESHALYLHLHAVCILFTGQKHTRQTLLLCLRFPQIRDY